MFVQKLAEQPGSLRDYVHNFTTYLAKAVAAGNLSNLKKGRWFMRGLPIKYYRHIIKKIGAVAYEPSTFVFERLKQTMLLQMTAVEGAERISVLSHENTQEMQLVRELRQQRDEVNRRREGRLLDLIGPIVHGGVLMRQQQPHPSVD